MVKLPNKRLVQAMEGYVLRMALLTSCWFILESILFPDGFLKLFHLSFHIHPLWYFLCQIFLWIKLLQRWLPLLVSLAIRVAWFVASNICTVFPIILSVFPFIKITNNEFANEAEVHEIPSATIPNQMADSCSSCYAASFKNEAKVGDEFANEVEEHEIPTATIENQMADTYSSCYAASIKNEEKVGDEFANEVEKHEIPTATVVNHMADTYSSCYAASIKSEAKVGDEFANEVEEHEFPTATVENQMADTYSSSNAVSIKNEAKVYALHIEEFEPDTDCSDNSPLVESVIRELSVLIDDDRSLEGYMPSESSSISSTQDTLPSLCGSNASIVERELTNQSMETDLDSIYQKYTERMRWFDLLNHDRTCGISAILNKQLAALSSFEDIKPVEFSIPQISWSKMARRRLIRSLESDFELVYVAQSCLSWELLNYQYRKVEALLRSNSQTGTFYDDVVGRFQKFQVLLERFMEDERCEGKRYWNYVQRRLTFRSLLQVPQVSAYTEEREDNEIMGAAMRATEVLQGIEKCIKAFWMYVKTDQKKPQWKMSKFMWTYPPVEDPRDLELLANLTTTLRKDLINIIHMLEAKNDFYFSEEGAKAKRLARQEEVLVEKRSKPSGSISREGNFVYNDRDEAGVKGAQNVDDIHFSTPMVPAEA